MSNRLETSQIVDMIIKFGSTGTVLAVGLVAPNLIQVLDEPMQKLYKHLDQRQREREAMRIIRNMKAQGYLAGDYEHGLTLTKKAQKRFHKITLAEAIISPQEVWDKKWRIIMYDIPQKNAQARKLLSKLLRQMGCFQLQKSVWITPFPCLELIENIAAQLEVSHYVSYFDTEHINNAGVLRERFQKKYPATLF